MTQLRRLRFGPYRLEGMPGQLFRRSHIVALPPKALTVLELLASRAGQLVSKDELLATGWPKTVVSEGVLTSCIRELRRALGDDSRQPRYIETVHRRGYRFIAPLTSAQPVSSSKFKVQSSKLTPSLQSPTPPLVGREAELAQLHQLWTKALNGERQTVFVTGEAGIGKTSVVDAFVQRLVFARGDYLASTAQGQEEPQKTNGKRPQPFPQPAFPIPASQSLVPILVGRGQCVEQYGVGEGYLPVLEGLGQLCQGVGGAAVIAQIRHLASGWLAQLPEVLNAEDHAVVQQQALGVTQGRLLHELAVGIEALARVQPVLLVLEDLQWCDPSTVTALELLARRQEAARLLVLGTYRPVDVILHEHALKAVKQELQLHGQCQEVVLGPLREDAVRAYATQRFAEGRDLLTLAAFLHRRSEGHPLFMVNVADHLARESGWAEASAAEITCRLARLEAEVPEQLRQFIAMQIGQLGEEERRVLEVASVAGAEFGAASVTAGLAVVSGAETETETVCEELARREQFIDDRGLIVRPDGTVTQRYSFRHALYREVLYRGVAEARRARLHRTIGEHLEAAYAGQTGKIAGELAEHFEQGRDLERAIQYRHVAGASMAAAGENGSSP